MSTAASSKRSWPSNSAEVTKRIFKNMQHRQAVRMRTEQSNFRRIIFCPRGAKSFSLSPRERAGVRGKSALFVLSAFIFVALGASVLAADQKISPSDLQFFESKIRPIFVENCYKCHSQGAEKIKGGLLLDTRDGALKGGNTAPAVLPCIREKS